MKLGPRYIGALTGLANGEYIGVGVGPTFSGAGPQIPWRLMSGLVDRGLARVDAAGKNRWRATITNVGRAALKEGSENG